MILVENGGIIADEMPNGNYKSVGNDSVIEPFSLINWDVKFADFEVKKEKE